MKDGIRTVTKGINLYFIVAKFSNDIDLCRLCVQCLFMELATTDGAISVCIVN